MVASRVTFANTGHLVDVYEKAWPRVIQFVHISNL